ncbi:HET-domain-containing protein [Lophium mytilinum]|uniref:HET-domain-containing protein n=1 Tax=Lophium mytilinum TaxID=390894 RepID=A0A6A6QLC9_9PEZI|nr:HET-domain-containing protein [Lophium mytilinum]
MPRSDCAACGNEYYWDMTQENEAENSSSSCPHCEFLLAAIKTIIEAENYQGKAITSIYVSNDPTVAKNPGFTSAWLSNGGYTALRRLIIEFCGVLKPEVDGATWNLPSPLLENHISGQTDSDRAFDWARNCFETCQSQHTKCKLIRDSTSRLPEINGGRPRRLLDLQDVHPSDDSRSFVKISEGVEESEPYTCLSYCWGPPPHFTLNSGNYQQMVSGLPLQSLPRALRDVMQFARRLSFRWIWIDALCLIQDDKDEMSEEIKRMGSIYNSAALTFSLETAIAACDGFYKNAHAKHRGMIPIGAPEEAYRLYKGVLVRKMLDHTLFQQFDNSTDTDHTDLNPLHTRAWVLQETMLSRRLLAFSGQELTWDCVEATACECSYMNRQMGTLQRSIIHNTNTLQDIPKEMLHGTLRSQTNIYSSWSRLLEMYCRRKLTVSSDRESGMMGLVWKYEMLLNDKLIAGMWSKHLRHSLCWWIDGSKARGYRSIWPTWSWLAAVPGEGAYLVTAEREPSARDTEFRICVMSGGDSLHTYRESKYYLEVAGTLVTATSGQKAPNNDGLFGAELEVHGQTLWWCLDQEYDPDIAGYWKLKVLLLGMDGEYYVFLMLNTIHDEAGVYERVGFGHTDIDIWTEAEAKPQGFKII